MSGLGDTLGDALGYVGSSIDKPGRAVRGLLAGKPREGMAALPFSDSLGLTDYHDNTTGRDLTNKWGMTRPDDKGWGAWGAGVGTELALDPLNLIPGGMLGHALKDSRLGKSAVGHVGKFMANDSGALGLPFDLVNHPPAGMLRSSPEWINNKTFYHGSGTPGMSGSALDPMKTAPDNLYGRGFYTTADESLAREYMDKGVNDAGHRLARSLTDDDKFWKSSMSRAKKGDFDNFLTGKARTIGFGPEEVAGLRPSMKLEHMRGLTEDHLNPFYAEGIAAGSPRLSAASEAAKLFAPHLQKPAASLYQMQSNFGNILDVEHAMKPTQYESLFDALQPALGHPKPHYGSPGQIAPTGEMQSPEAIIKYLRGVQDGSGRDMLVHGLRSQGYDAMTHTGGVTLGGPVNHQVVIGLDPNDVLGMGRSTPYKRFERMQ